ncbi:hypothetical protein EPK97_15145 [Chengkuizengella sediminis]|nr:hypothetical protein [Chengkuizengella sediminis]
MSYFPSLWWSSIILLSRFIPSGGVCQFSFVKYIEGSIRGSEMMRKLSAS